MNFKQTLNVKQIKMGRTGKIDELYKYEKKTRNYEWRHIIGNVLLESNGHKSHDYNKR